jgi:predicted DCC family thiol-disulfide oxidoreductase YuxK
MAKAEEGAEKLKQYRMIARCRFFWHGDHDRCEMAF